MAAADSQDLSSDMERACVSCYVAMLNPQKDNLCFLLAGNVDSHELASHEASCAKVHAFSDEVHAPCMNFVTWVIYG